MKNEFFFKKENHVPDLKKKAEEQDALLRDAGFVWDRTEQNSAQVEEPEENPVEQAADTEKSAPEEPAIGDDVAYRELLDYFDVVHAKCQQLLKIGLIVFVCLPILLNIMRELSEMDKVVSLLVWIICMFFLAAFLIYVSFFDTRLKHKVDSLNAKTRRKPGSELLLVEPIGPIGKKLMDFEQDGEEVQE